MDNNLTVKELKVIAKEMGLKGYSKLNKKDLIQFIQDNEVVEQPEKSEIESKYETNIVMELIDIKEDVINEIKKEDETTAKENVEVNKEKDERYLELFVILYAIFITLKYLVYGVIIGGVISYKLGQYTWSKVKPTYSQDYLDMVKYNRSK